MNVGMGHLVPGDDHAHPLTCEGALLGLGNPMSDGEQMCIELWGRVDPMVDFFDRNDEDVARCHRIDRHERDTVLVAMDEGSGDVAADDHGEDGAHTSATVRAPYAEGVTSDGVPSDPSANRDAADAEIDLDAAFDHGALDETGEPGLFDDLWTAPNLFTLARLLCLPVFLWLLFSADNRAGAAWMLVALGSTDWVDGYIARRFDQVSEFGKIFDPTVDRLFFFVSIIAIIIDGSIPLWFALAVLFRELVVAATMTIATVFFGMERFDVTWWGKTATFLLMGAVPSFLISNADVVESDFFRVVAWAIGIPGLALSYWTAVGYIPDVRAGIAAGRAHRADRVPSGH